MAASEGIGVESYAELYTTILGWHQYNLLWDLLTDTGLVFVPFLGMLIRHVSEAIRSQTGVDASVTTLKRLEVDFLQMLIVILLAGQPLIDLKVSELKFIKLCTNGFQGGEQEFRVNDPNDNSLYKQSTFIEKIEDAKVPIWWFGVMSVSSGFTHAAKKSLPCLPYSKDALHGVRAALSDGVFKEQLRQFIEECYNPVKNFVTNESKRLNPEDWNKAGFDALVEKHGTGNNFEKKFQSIDWIGSPVYLEMTDSRFYRFILPSQTRNIRKTGFGDPPSCADWWFGYNVGQGKIIGIPGIKTKIERSFNNLILTQSEYTKNNLDQTLALITREVVRRNFVLGDQLFPSLNNLTEKSWKDTFWEWVAELGLRWNSLVVYPVTHAVQTASPIVLSLMLVSLYIMLPLGLVISSYSLEFLLAATVGLFTIKFLSYFFLVAYWLDQNLLLVTGGEGTELSNMALSTFNFIVNSTLFAFPILFMMVMSWTGINIGSTILNAFDKLGGRTSAVGQGAAYIGQQVQQLLKMVGRMIRKALIKV